jgi:hypothetical protein
MLKIVQYFPSKQYMFLLSTGKNTTILQSRRPKYDNLSIAGMEISTRPAASGG